MLERATEEWEVDVVAPLRIPFQAPFTRDLVDPNT